ncbi:MAG: hypothetical protein GWN64_07180, partial [Candidatus Thorarchaeota archaeon]|nr:hypothetical protein [Candidatus Thorarchaeota archaeon]
MFSKIVDLTYLIEPTTK